MTAVPLLAATTRVDAVVFAACAVIVLAGAAGHEEDEELHQ